MFRRAFARKTSSRIFRCRKCFIFHCLFRCSRESGIRAPDDAKKRSVLYFILSFLSRTDFSLAMSAGAATGDSNAADGGGARRTTAAWSTSTPAANSTLALSFIAPPETDISHTHAERFPNICGRRTLVDDALLQEVYMAARGLVFLPTTSFVEWVPPPTVPLLVSIGDTAPTLVGGMLHYDGDFFFGNMPMVLDEVREVKFRLNMSDEMRMRSAVAFGRSSPSSESASKPAAGTGAPPSRAAGAAAPGGAPVDPLRVAFRLTVYNGWTDPWTVQLFQLLGPNGPTGKVFSRAFLPVDAAAAGAGALVAGLSMAAGDALGGATARRGTSWTASDAASPLGASSRKAVSGEEGLRAANPALFGWCVSRDPFELGAASTLVRNALLYFKTSFTFTRTVRAMLRALRRLQRFFRAVLQHRRNAVASMLAGWAALENRKLAQLRALETPAGDAVEAVVRSLLIECIVLSPEDKAAILRRVWDRKKAEFRAALTRVPPKRPTDRPLLVAWKRFGWSVDPAVLFRMGQAQLSERLTSGPTSLFRHSVIEDIIAHPPTRAQERKARGAQCSPTAADAPSSFPSRSHDPPWR